MSNPWTLPSRRACLPVKAIRLEVVRGPDAGRRFEAARETVSVGTAAGNDFELTDPTVSRLHLELERRADRILVRDHGSTNGTRIGPVLLQDQTASVTAGADLDLGETRLKLHDGEVVLLDVRGSESLGELRGRTPGMQRLMATVQRLGRSEVPVLLLGESGTGKELVARALHELGDRAEGPFVTVDCGAVSSELFMSELFGHERGAFTGADRRHAGAFERAHGGTLFLDEIGELSPPLQSALLGVLERRRFRRVGGREEIPVDVRVVSATHRDLRSAVNGGAFRLDLWYRIAVALVALPPLRERPEDIPLLVEHFARQAGHDGPIEPLFPAERMEALGRHRWPGNVRELRNLVEATLALGEQVEPITGPGVAAAAGVAAPGPALAGGNAASPATDPGGPDLVEQVLGRSYREARQAVLQEFESRYLRHLLERAGGSVRQAAREARMDRSYLIELLRRHGLP